MDPRLVVIGENELRDFVARQVANVVEPLRAAVAELVDASAFERRRTGGLEPMLRAPEVSEFLRVNVREVRRLIKEGRFPDPAKVGARAIRRKRATIDAWLERGESTAAKRS